MDRREFLKTTGSILLASTTLLLPESVLAVTRQDTFWSQDRVLWMRRRQTGESAVLRFWSNGRYDMNEVARFCYMMRDVVDRGAIVPMDIGLMNLYYGIQEWSRQIGVRDPRLDVNSGHRTPQHNANLEGAVQNSLHIPGRAGDGNIRGLEPDQMAAKAKFFNIGGVGIYDTFVHTDTGRVRYWHGSS